MCVSGCMSPIKGMFRTEYSLVMSDGTSELDTGTVAVAVAGAVEREKKDAEDAGENDEEEDENNERRFEFID